MNARWKVLADQFGAIGREITLRRFQTGEQTSWSAFSDFGGPPCRQQFIILASEAGQLLGDTSIAPEYRWYSELWERHPKAADVFSSWVGTSHGHDGVDRPLPHTGSEIAKAAAVSQRLATELAECKVPPRLPAEGSKPTASKKQRSTKDETQAAVYAAIVNKMNHPEWSELKVAEESEIPPSTLNGHPEWQEWKSKIEAAHSGPAAAKVRREFDRRAGKALEVDPASEYDPHTGRRFT